VKTLYTKIKELCKKHNVSVSELENELGFSRGSLCKWSVNVPSIVKVKAVADYFHVTVDELLKEGEKKDE
jgi:transcriptional regulator with XRE-family HTH domain